jgi:hypothetical protein
LPFSARVCLNQHRWLANRMRTEGIDFEQCSNAFLKCSHPQKLQQLADSLSAHDLLSCGQKWLACLTPFFKEKKKTAATRLSPVFRPIATQTPCLINSSSKCFKNFSSKNGPISPGPFGDTNRNPSGVGCAA